MTDEPVLQMSDITKEYFGVKALHGVSLEVRGGEVHALMGENGAGKSTLMKILTGLVRPDGGGIRFYGKEVKINTMQDAMSLGIAMIHQELNPVAEMTIAENIFLGREPIRGRWFVNRKRLRQETRKLLEEYGLAADPDTKVGELSIAQKQMLEIIKALSSNVRLIIMDEPTSALSDSEVKTLFRMIAGLKERGVPIIYISHRMDEIFHLSDRITVLRDGRYIGTADIAEITPDQLISMMVGRTLDAIYPDKARTAGKVVLEAKGLTNKPYFEDVSFHVREGEILGIAGLMGAGRSEVMRALFGIDRLESGQIFLEGRPVRIAHPAEAIACGMAMVTEDRKDQGLVLCRSIRENMTLARLKDMNKGPFVSGSEEDKLVDALADKLRIKMRDAEQLVQNLSGGNQQKVVLAKWLLTGPRVLILDEPTRGIDVGAKAEIYNMIAELAAEGMAIIMISSELPEVLGLSTRILVMGQGRIKGEFEEDDITQEQILACAIGGVSIA